MSCCDGRFLDELVQSGGWNRTRRRAAAVACAAGISHQSDEFVFGEQLIRASNVDQYAIQTVNLDESNLDETTIAVVALDSLDHFFLEAARTFSRKIAVGGGKRSRRSLFVSHQAKRGITPLARNEKSIVTEQKIHAGDH